MPCLLLIISAITKTAFWVIMMSMLLLPKFFVFIAAGLRLLGGLAYFRATLSGRAKPNPLTWLLWAVTPLVTLAAGLVRGEADNMVVTLALAASPMLVFIAAMKTDPKLLKFDWLNLACIILTGLGVLLWIMTDNPILAIGLAIAADFISAVPTIIKTFKQPETEYAPTYFMSAIAMLMTLMTTPRWTLTNAAFVFYVMLINITLSTRITVDKWRQAQKLKY